MYKTQPNLEWQYLSEDDPEAPWPPAPIATERQTGLRVRRMVVFAITMGFLLTAGIGTIYARNEAQKGIDEVENVMQDAVLVDAWEQEYAPVLSAEMLIDDADSSYVEWMMASENHLLRAVTRQEMPASELQVTETRFRGSSAAAEVRVTLPASQRDGKLVLHQTRFYRETSHGWLRTRPLPALWGQPRSLETEHLDWRYRQRDEDVVLEIAQRMDAMYAELLTDYGLNHVPRKQKLIVDVRVDYLPGKLMLQKDPANLVTVPSSAVYLMPEKYADTDVLAQAVGLALLENLWYQAVLAHSEGRDDALLAGVRLWELQEMGTGLSPSTQYALLGGRDAEDMHTTCAAYAVWMLRPMAAGVPVHCEGTQADALSYRLESVARYSLRDVGRHDKESPVGFTSGWAISLEAPNLVTSVVDYSVAAYGRESLPELLAGLGQHTRWETLVPATYGVSLDEFEAGWRTHLAALVK